MALSNTLWIKFFNSHSKYKPELNKYFHIYRCQLDFTLFCATGALVISCQHLNHPNLLVHSVYRFHVYFHVGLILHDLSIPLPDEDGFSKVMLILNIHITVPEMTMTLMQMKHRCIGIGFIRLVMVFLVMK